jgi:hypothetical protein
MMGEQVLLYTYFLLPHQGTKLADPKLLALDCYSGEGRAGTSITWGLSS